MQDRIYFNFSCFKVIYSANAIQEGRLVYAHFGRFSDFDNLRRLFNYNFSHTVVMIKTYSPLYDTASAVRNAQAFGARAVILFPDPNNYILTKESKVGKFVVYFEQQNIQHKFETKMIKGPLVVLECFFSIDVLLLSLQ